MIQLTSLPTSYQYARASLRPRERARPSRLCESVALVSHVHPHLSGAQGVGSLAGTEQAMTKAMHEEHAKALVALADCLTALQAASRELERDPGNATAVRDYNFGIARIFQIIDEAKLDPWRAPLTIPSPAGDFTLAHKPDPRPEWNPALYQFTPADEFDVGGKYVTERTTRYGIGASPLWTATKNLSTRPVRNARGVIESPESTGLRPISRPTPSLLPKH